ncbi:hypothetical protein GW17_00008591 [Ensete ventricosum]|nr:hypothetical protein GW17_00008591 [Ensete ventricosum]
MKHYKLKEVLLLRHPSGQSGVTMPLAIFVYHVFSINYKIYIYFQDGCYKLRKENFITLE